VANVVANLSIRGPSSNRPDSTPARTCTVTPLYMAAKNPTRLPEFFASRTTSAMASTIPSRLCGCSPEPITTVPCQHYAGLHVPNGGTGPTRMPRSPQPQEPSSSESRPRHSAFSHCPLHWRDHTRRDSIGLSPHPAGSGDIWPRRSCHWSLGSPQAER